MNVLVIDVGGTHVKILATGQNEKREFVSGPKPRHNRWSGVRQLADGWSHDAVSIGYPGPVLQIGRVADPKNLGARLDGLRFQDRVWAANQGSQRRRNAGARQL